MADATAKKLLELLSGNKPAELRCSAARVLGEIGTREPAVARALTQALGDEDASVRRAAIDAVGRLRIDSALPLLLERVGNGGEEGEAAARSAASLGQRATRALRDMMGKTAPGLRRRIAAALAAGDHASAETAAVDALLDNDPGVVDASARSLINKVPTLDARHRRALVDRTIELLKTHGRRSGSLPAVSEAALLRLLAALKDPRGEELFADRLEAAQPVELRAAALQALGTLPTPTKPERIKRLLACAADPNFRVAAPALLILKDVPVSTRGVADWLPLLESVDPAARRFAIDKIGSVDDPRVASALARQLTFHERSVRELAAQRLGGMKHGPAAMVDALLEADSSDLAWSLARAQADRVADYPPALRDKIFKQACAYLDAGAGDDRRAEALLFTLRTADARGLRDRLEERALALRKKKQYDRALLYWRLLSRDPACSESVRFEQAACSLKLSAHDLAADARAGDPCLHQFAGLFRRHETDPLVMIDKARWLDAEDLFYLGFHFAEATGKERELGADLLRLVIKRSPRSKLARDARSKLRSQGLSLSLIARRASEGFPALGDISLERSESMAL